MIEANGAGYKREAAMNNVELRPLKARGAMIIWAALKLLGLVATPRYSDPTHPLVRTTRPR